MNRALVIGLGVAALALLYWVCAGVHGPAIEADISARAMAALDGDGIRWAQVQPDGRMLHLSGVAPSAEASARAERLVAGLGGVRSVDNALRIEAPTPAGSIPPPSQPSPLSLSLRREAQRVTLSGSIRNEAERRALVEEAGRFFDSARVIDELHVQSGGPEDWSRLARVGLDTLQRLEQGEVALDERSMSVLGTVPTVESRAEVEDLLQDALPVRLSRSVQLSVSAVAPAELSAEACQEELATLLAASGIRFGTGRSEIDPLSLPLLDRLAEVAGRCRGAMIEVAGHTDDSGAAAFNLRLSEQRAAAVVAYLVERGLSPQRLVARGYGEEMPVASNATAEGRARNRRIEFNVRGN